MRKYVKNFVATHRRLVAIIALFVFAGVFSHGMVRSCYYDLPMLQADYEQAATPRAAYVAPESEIQSKMDFKDKWYALTLLWLKARYDDYVDLAVGDRSQASFDAGAALYIDHDIEDARFMLEKAYIACCDKQGNILPKYCQLGSDIQLLIGNTYAERNMTEEATRAYELSLQLDPNNRIKIRNQIIQHNICATYNLERLQDSDPKSDKQPQPGRGPKQLL